MRLLLIYDLPMLEDEDKRTYQRFHNKLISIGFYMLQYSVLFLLIAAKKIK